MKVLWLVFLCVPPSLGIIGGDIARASQFPFAAAIYTTTEIGTYFCAGALISNQWVLTAAQCINQGKQLTIHLGSNNLQGEDPHRVTVATATFVLHPDYNPTTLENDIGLIRLRLPVEFNAYITGIPLSQNELADLANVTAIGWGQESDKSPGLVNNLRFVSLSAINNDECRSHYGEQIFDNMVCVLGAYNEGTCTGDSGGPLVEYANDRDVELVAISSFVSGHGCESTYPSGYTRTYPYLGWIKTVVSEMA